MKNENKEEIKESLVWDLNDPQFACPQRKKMYAKNCYRPFPQHCGKGL